MPSPHYPTIDITFLEFEILNCGKVLPQSKIKVGSTTIFLIDGLTKAIYRRQIFLRELDPGQIGLEMATGIAFRLGFLGNLMKWLEDNRGWKEGAYIVQEETLTESK